MVSNGGIGPFVTTPHYSFHDPFAAVGTTGQPAGAAQRDRRGLLTPVRYDVMLAGGTLAQNADGRLEVFAGDDNAVRHIWQTAPNNGWSGCASLGAAFQR